MTNMIKAEDLDHMDRIETADGEPHTVNHTRRIDHERVRIMTLEGRVIIANLTDCFHRAL